MTEKKIYTRITGSGRYIPTRRITNEHFLDNEFYKADGEKIAKSNENIISTLQKITEIEERRYIEDEYLTSDMAFFAAQNAIDSAKMDAETLDYIIVAHNFGDIPKGIHSSDMFPALASRVNDKI